MAVTLQDLFGDPALFLHQLDDNHAVFQTMTREDVAKSIFLDGRIRRRRRRSDDGPCRQDHDGSEPDGARPPRDAAERCAHRAPLYPGPRSARPGRAGPIAPLVITGVPLIST